MNQNEYFTVKKTHFLIYKAQKSPHGQLFNFKRIKYQGCSFKMSLSWNIGKSIYVNQC